MINIIKTERGNNDFAGDKTDVSNTPDICGNQDLIAEDTSHILGDIISEEDAINLLKSNEATYSKFLLMDKKYQDLIILFMTGRQSIKITYDPIFKKTFDIDCHKDRLEALLSSILGFVIHIEQILNNEGIRLHEKATFVVMDIICRDKSGSIINVEMQKLGYDFPGERASCYNADMVMREYNNLRNQLKEEFSYKKMKPVYLIILMEESSKNFLSVSPEYFHKIEHICSSGAKVSELFKTYYISLDTFDKTNQNIITDRDAWLTFLSTTDLRKIERLVKMHPEFNVIYGEIAKFRQSPEGMVDMVSEMIETLDHNTILYMVDEMKEEIRRKDDTIREKDDAIREKDAIIAELMSKIKE